MSEFAAFATTYSASYSQVHAALRRERGPASARACHVCGRRAHEWACFPCDDAAVISGTNASGRDVSYSLDVVGGYVPMCRTHHAAFDRARRLGVPFEPTEPLGGREVASPTVQPTLPGLENR